MLVLILVVFVVFVAMSALQFRRDAPRALLEAAVRRLSDDRQVWGEAMVAELQSITGSVARWRFGLGCARVALLPPRRPGSSYRSRDAAVAVGLSALGLALYTRFRLVGTSYSDSTQHDAPYEVMIWMIVFAVFASYAAVAVVRLRIVTPRAAMSRRYGLIGGVISGVFVLAACSPALMRASDSDPLSLVPNGWLFMMALAAPLLLAVAAVRATGHRRAGVDTGWWAGVIGGSIVVVGLLALTCAAPHWFAHSPATITAYHSYWPPRGTHQTHFRNITAFLLNANLDTAAIVGVLGLPALGYLVGGIGGALGAVLPTPRAI